MAILLAKGSCNHDHVLIFGGYNNLEGYRIYMDLDDKE